MGVFFGTDGIRGVVNNTLTYDLAYKCGNAVGISKPKPKILIGGDTRATRQFLTAGVSVGAMNAGADILDVGICPTAGIAYLTKRLGYDYGIVISASHNSSEYNGIKIFDCEGVKLGDEKEDALERKFISQTAQPYNQIGKSEQDFSIVKYYEDYLASCCNGTLEGLSILLDGSNGAAYKVAPSVFRKLGAKVIATNCHDDGEHINNNCGSTHPETLSKMVKKYKTDMGFAFDGDSDRIIACDENGNILDGDMLIYMLANYLKSQNKLKDNYVVGTRHTNKGIENTLNNNGISLIRTDIGDKYVIAKLQEKQLSLGGEKSGHIIFREYATTGDGILTGIKIAEMVKETKKKISELARVELYPQCNLDCIVKDKMKVINSAIVSKEIEKQEKILGENARVMVRVSGTEAKIRIMTECDNEAKAVASAKEIEKVVYLADNEL